MFKGFLCNDACPFPTFTLKNFLMDGTRILSSKLAHSVHVNWSRKSLKMVSSCSSLFGRSAKSRYPEWRETYCSKEWSEKDFVKELLQNCYKELAVYK